MKIQQKSPKWLPEGTLGWPWGPLAHPLCTGTPPGVVFETILAPIWGPFWLPFGSHVGVIFRVFFASALGATGRIWVPFWFHFRSIWGAISGVPSKSEN